MQGISQGTEHFTRMPWGLKKDGSGRLVLCEVDAGSGSEANELAHLLFKLSQISKLLERHDCCCHQHIINKIHKTKAEIIDKFVNGKPTSQFVAKVVHRIRGVQRDVEKLENRHSSYESSRGNLGHDYLSYIVHKFDNDNHQLEENKRVASKTQRPVLVKTRKWNRKQKTKKGKTISSTSFKTESRRKIKRSDVKSSSSRGLKVEPTRERMSPLPKPKESGPTQEKKVQESATEQKVIDPIPSVSPNKKSAVCQGCKCCCLEKFQQDQAEMKRILKLQSIVKSDNNCHENNSDRNKEAAKICTIFPSRTSFTSRRKTRLDPRFSYKVLKRCPPTCCPIHIKRRELKNDTSCLYEQKKDSLYYSAKAFAKSVAGRGAAFLSPLNQKHKSPPATVKDETVLLPPPPSPNRHIRKDHKSEKLICKSTVTPKLVNVDKATSYERFYINPLGIPDKLFKPINNNLINEEWRYFGDKYPLKLDKIEHLKGEGVEYSIRRPAEDKTKIDSETQTEDQSLRLEYKVTNMNIVYSKTHLDYIVPSWKESSVETVSTPKILCKKELEGGLAATTYKMDPDGTIYFTLAYSTDSVNDDGMDVQHSENHLSKLKNVKDVWVQSARHLYNSLKATYSATSSRDSSH